MKFQTSIHVRDDITFLKVVGIVDEDNELAELSEGLAGSTVVVDLGGVERINSYGTRDWVNWLSSLEAKRTHVVFVECSPAVIAQVNQVSNFAGKGVVKSFYVPYFCAECDEEKVLLVESIDMGAAPYEPPVCRCDECDQVMEFDDMADQYFAFLRTHRSRVKDSGRIRNRIDELVVPSGSGKVRTAQPGSNQSSKGASQELPSVPSLPKLEADQHTMKSRGVKRADSEGVSRTEVKRPRRTGS